MKVIIPMAGTGNRFVEKGYNSPKPLIKVNNKRIIEYILDPFDDEDEIVFICNEQHIQTTDMNSVLKELRPNSTIVSMPNHKLGPVYTVKPFYDLINDDEEVMVSYCDNAFVWDKQLFVNHVQNNNYDGCILTHTGLHPHTLNSTKMAFLKTQNDLLLEIKEKECYTDDPLSEHASTGAYYFRKGSLLKKYFDLLIETNLNHNGEYYVTLVYNLLVKDNLRIGYFDTEFVTVFGTPEEVESFEAWQTILTSGQVKSAEDLVNCFNYWKRYNDRNIC